MRNVTIFRQEIQKWIDITHHLDEQVGISTEDKNCSRDMVLFHKKMHEFAIERIISGDWDKFSEDHGPDLDDKSCMSKEDPFEIHIRSALSRTLYKEIRQDDWLKKNL